MGVHEERDSWGLQVWDLQAQTAARIIAICHCSRSRNEVKRKVLRHANPSDGRQSTHGKCHGPIRNGNNPLSLKWSTKSLPLARPQLDSVYLHT